MTVILGEDPMKIVAVHASYIVYAKCVASKIYLVVALNIRYCLV